MKLKIYSVYDSKAKAYNSPFYLRNSGEATRGFSDVVNDGKSQISKYPEDYTLFELGEFDDEMGSIAMYDAKITLGGALQFKKETTIQSVTNH